MCVYEQLRNPTKTRTFILYRLKHLRLPAVSCYPITINTAFWPNIFEGESVPSEKTYTWKHVKWPPTSSMIFPKQYIYLKQLTWTPLAPSPTGLETKCSNIWLLVQEFPTLVVNDITSTCTHILTHAEDMLISCEPGLMQTPLNVQTSRHTLPVLLSLYRHNDLQAFYYPTRNRKSGKFPNVTSAAGRWSHLDFNVLVNHVSSSNFHSNMQIVLFAIKLQHVLFWGVF